MGVYTELPSEVDTVDIIIAGGGTAGCVVAGRLAAADPNLSILVIESGPDGAGNPLVEIAALFLANLTPTSTTVTFHKSHASDKVGGREVIVPISNVLGGGSSVNMMMYSRAARTDWDSWKTPGWSADEITPFVKKLEKYEGPGKKDTHGSDGPIHISTGTFASPRAQDAFVSGMNALGWPEIEDINDLESCNGVQKALRYISPDGKRQDTASRYLRPNLEKDQSQRLHVLVESKVVRVVIEDGKATGVVYRSAADKTERTVKATKLVVVSAGAFGSPAILERSGVGNPEVLEKAGVKVVNDLPGVGEHYSDHQLCLYAYKSSLELEETMDGILNGALSPPDLIKANHGILGWNAQDVTAKIRPNEKDVSELGTKFQEAWKKDYENIPSKPLMMLSLVVCFPGEPVGIPKGQYFGISAFSTYPYSRGHVHITGPGLDDPSDFDTGFFSDEGDVDLLKQRWGYKKQREAARRMNVFRGELAVAHPPFPPESKAACKDTDGPLENVTDIEYSAEDDAILDEWLRKNVGSAWHSQGTCKMAPKDQGGVVDEHLGVHGISGLKVADLSIVPENVASNTNNTAIVVGEKAADIIIKELGL
jgi:alcohol oxidase